MSTDRVDPRPTPARGSFGSGALAGGVIAVLSSEALRAQNLGTYLELLKTHGGWAVAAFAVFGCYLFLRWFADRKDAEVQHAQAQEAQVRSELLTDKERLLELVGRTSTIIERAAERDEALARVVEKNTEVLAMIGG